MARGKKTSQESAETKTADYRHDASKRKNIPPAKIAAEGKVPAVPKAQYYYSPHLSPVLRFDPAGKTDRIQDLIAEAARRPLRAEEQALLRQALRQHEPWLEWATKREQHERGFFEVDPVALHIHERVSTRAILDVARKQQGYVQRDLFADPQQPYHEAIQFYKHDVDWANRLILGDSLQVMSSLARRENLAGKVQMIYMDPPYGIKFASNFQPEVGKNSVKETEEDLTREAEMVRAYRDTWRLGTHSYLSYLRDRLLLARELLAETGSIFVQISDENLHRVRMLLDGVFGSDNFRSVIAVKKTAGLGTQGLSAVCDYILWYARNLALAKQKAVFVTQDFSDDPNYVWHITLEGEKRRLIPATGIPIPANWRLFRHQIFLAAGRTTSCVYRLDLNGECFFPTANRSWSTNPEGTHRLKEAHRLTKNGNTVNYVRYASDFGLLPLSNMWSDGASGVGMDKVYVVQTNIKVVQRCLLMTTDPGDLVLDPTCGSGTTAQVAEQWGRRWITIDTSRVAVAVARQRLLTAKFEHYRTKGGGRGNSENPATGFLYKKVPHIAPRTIAQNTNLDPIFAKHEPILETALATCSKALATVPTQLHSKLKSKHQAKQTADGKKSITDADTRRWQLPESGRFEHWTVPFDTDADWPKALQDAVTAYRKAWRAKMDEVNACISANAESEELVDQPEVVKGVLRVSGPFTVEGVRPAELSLAEAGLFGGSPEEPPGSDGDDDDDSRGTEVKNLQAYLAQMVQYLRSDGITFLNNQNRKLQRIEPLFEESTGSLIHAEGLWEGEDSGKASTIAVTFGPQYGPVTAQQVEEAVRASRRYDELVVAGFSFDAAASAVIQESAHPKLRIHQAYIRPDINPGMEGLLKETPNSQLFTVFGQPEIEVKTDKSGKLTCTLKGVDIYDPVANTVRSSGAEKVAAWFLDSDFDGRCFCIAQAFFPDQDAWEKIAKALSSSADTDAFEAFKGTTSLPFEPGKHRRIAVKVIDPRGNEVMSVRNLDGARERN